jgi:hypothetical protein
MWKADKCGTLMVYFWKSLNIFVIAAVVIISTAFIEIRFTPF